MLSSKQPVQFGTIVYNFENYHSVALIGINISEFSPGTTFSYSAAIAIQRDVATSIVNPDTVVSLID